MAAGTPYDFLRAHPLLFQDAGRKCVVSGILFFCSFVRCLREAVTVRNFSGGSSQALIRYRKNCAEPYAGDASAYLALLQQTSGRLEREKGKQHDSIHLQEPPHARQTICVLETDDADGIRAFRSVLDDGAASAEMRAPGVVDLRVATYSFFSALPG